ncbi:MAG: Hvo_1808 family surface protein [Halapricum sp.]
MRTARGLAAVALLCLVGLFVTIAPAAIADSDPTAVHTNGTAVHSNGSVTWATQDAGAPADPPEDRIGWEQGYWYNESIDVDQSDGLSEAELQRYKARTMARLEHIRGLEFTDDVEIEFIGSDAVADRIEGDVTQFRGSDQQWEALFVIGEDRNASRVITDTLVASVAGWAAEEGSEKVVLITEDPDEPTAPPVLMAHELTHVLQHQQFDLSDPRYQRSTMDGEHAKDAIVEGEASHLDSVYQEYCSNGTWECVDDAEGFTTGPWSDSVEFELSSYLSAPYSLGSQYVSELTESGGYEAVDATHRDPPAYSVAAFHVDESIQPDAPLSVPDRSNDAWNRNEPPDRVGSMALRSFASDVYREWHNGALYPYTNGSADGYVWETRWASDDAAEGFANVSRQRISNQDGTWIDDGVWVIPDGPFADAFAINRTGTTVRIVNAPTIESLSGVHAGSGPNASDLETTEPPETTTEPVETPIDTVETTSESAGADGEDGTPTGVRDAMTVGTEETATAVDDGPGFGIAAALVGLFIVAFAKSRSS